MNSVEQVDSLPFQDPAPDGEFYIVADVSIENTSNQPIPFSRLNAQVQDAEGREYDTLTAPEPDLVEAEMAPGDVLRGNLAFQVPHRTELILSYASEFLNESGAIRVALGTFP